MDDITICVLFTFTALLAVCYFWIYKKREINAGRTIPGPPLIEGLKFFMKGILNNTLHLKLPEWAEKYGDIMQVNLLIKKVIFINNADVFKRLVKDEDFRDFTNDRPPNFFAEYINGGDKEIVLAQYGPTLQYRRKIFHNILKFYGEGRGQFEELMVSSLTELTEQMKKQKSINLSVSIRNYILGLIGFLLTGEISATANKNIVKLQDFSDSADNIASFENESILQAFPSIRFVPGLRFKRLFDALYTAKEILHDTYFYAMKQTFHPTKKRGMIDELISLQKEEGNETVLDDATIKALIQDVVGAAFLTSSSTLTTLFLHLIKFPNIQGRVFQEIKNVIGDSTPSFKHRQHMPYTEAVILETLRISSIVPFLVPHFTRSDIVFDGYFIPKSTSLIMNAWHNHHRQDFWKNPWSFMPERFLDANGQLLESKHPTRQRLIAFGTGRRACPGETFGKSRVFLVTTFLLKTFQFVPDDSERLPSINPADWVGKTVLSPDQYKCKAKLRAD